MIPDGPTLIYDKSTVQSLTAKEAYWLHHHFHIVLTPTVFIEVLADLKKESKRGKTPEEEVAILADKIPSYAITPNMDFSELVIGDLVHETIEFGRRPYLGGGKHVQDSDGTWGAYFEESQAAKALRHWKEKDFTALEREMAAEWRQLTSDYDLTTIRKSMKWAEERIKHLKTPQQVLSHVETTLSGQNYKILMLALGFLRVPIKYHKHILARWVHNGRKPLPEFAPYAAYVLKVEMFFNLLLARGLISDQRSTHKVDFSYLYYLPIHKNIYFK